MSEQAAASAGVSTPSATVLTRSSLARDRSDLSIFPVLEAGSRPEMKLRSNFK